MKIDLNNLLGAIILFFLIICLILVISSCAASKPTPIPIPSNYRFVKVATLDKDGTISSQFIKEIK